jgi:hypothetical protein
MNIFTKALVGVVAAGVFASPLQAAEGILILEKTVMGSNTRSSQVQIERDRMRAELTGAAGEVQIVVFDGPGQVLRIISVPRKSYTEMTKADADRMGAQVAAAMAVMKDKMASMPPEQRAKMEALMSQLGTAGPAGAPGGRPEYRRAGSDKVGKWACDKYEGFRNGKKVSEVCTVEPKVLGLTEADFDVTKQVASFFEKMLPQGVDQLVGVGKVETQGFRRHSNPPLRLTTGDKVLSISEVTDVKRENFDASTYEVPRDFRNRRWDEELVAARPELPSACAPAFGRSSR